MDYHRKKAFFHEIMQQIEAGIILQPSNSHNFEEKKIIHLLQSQKLQFEYDIGRLKSKEKEWHEYMTTWVHEIKTPISVSKMIFESESSLDSLEEEMDKIEHLVDQALYYTRASDFSKDYFIQELDAESIIKEVIKGNRKLFISKKIKVQLNLSPLEVLTDKKGLLFIINQILSNSLKYTPPNGEIVIQIDTNKRKIIIHDNGIGISTEDLPRVFEKGFTGINGRQFSASTGMGLYLAKTIAGKLGHQLEIHSLEGTYTESSITFSKTVDHFREELNPFSYKRT
ncbi:sensor histidine kinase [Bacillus niameyensis]|uniref:sensor histidine kinase n=1 Tax=Bacillus niameyensis TaxID=1522308 RepID=UPI001E581B53|nr:sensor histidine kinase [Bacillus niameyensis]